MKKLLIVCQAVDERDPVLGFFTRWIEALAPSFERIEVICLFEGAHALPASVRVHSLGKERIPAGKADYALRFLRHALRLRRDYDAVFVHMNEEYLLVAGLLWKLLGKPAYLWRNHGSGSFLTRVAAAFCRKVFYTSTSSYTATLKNAVRMPVGVDLERFQNREETRRVPGSVLMAGRIAPKKRVREVVEALVSLARKGTHLPLTLVGPTAPEHEAYRNECVALASAAGIGLSLRGGVKHEELPSVFAEHDIVVNASEPGMFDKTMLEALASGCLLLTRHEDLGAELDLRERTLGSPLDMGDKLSVLAKLPGEERERLVEAGKSVAARHSLRALVARLREELYA